MRKRTRQMHGMTGTRIYTTWNNMKKRCLYPKHPHFEIYGGRGIGFCAEWNDFLPFYEWAMSHGYSDDLTLDRIDVNGNYEPSNCRWVDMTTQIRNRRDSRKVEIDGVVHTLKEWAEISGISFNTICTRYIRGKRGKNLIKKCEKASSVHICSLKHVL